MKAVITAANPHHRNLPVQTLSDSNGEPVPLLALHLRDLDAAGVEEVAVVHHPEDAELYRAAAGSYGKMVRMVPQADANGFGDAVLRARSFVGEDPFVLLVCDHLFLSNDAARNCVQQLVEAYRKVQSPVAAVQPTHESLVSSFGVVAGEPLARHPGMFKVREVREKPTPTEAELYLRVPGNRAGYYLGFFGMHVLDGQVFEMLELTAEAGRPLGLSPALDAMARRSRLHAFRIEGRRFDLEADYGLLQAQLAMALAGPNREMVLADLVRTLAG
jgi:UTP--glucose-1-phosphate uridylyltransferase